MRSRCTLSFLFLWIATYMVILPFAYAGEGKWINPITDVCWDCLFPMTISGVNVTPGEKDLTKYNKALCFCSGTPPKAGLPMSFWEPRYLVDVTRHPYKLIGLGGISIGKESVKNRGTIGIIGDGPSQYSFYHVHWYKFPILALLNLFTDFSCIQKEGMEITYMSEWDPLWNDDEWAAVLHPEAGLFASSVAQVACVADCTASSFDRPLDPLFWCAGCQGSLYPFTGTVAHHLGGIQTSALLVHRLIAKLHRSSLLKGFTEDNFCEAQYLPIIKKSLYKIQLIHPKPQRKGPCHALGKSNLIWGMAKSYPYEGEDFVYLVWVKKQCCLDAVKPTTSALGGL